MNEACYAECQIESLAYGGDGVARIDGCVLFVPETAVGDQVRVRITQRKKRFARGVIETIAFARAWLTCGSWWRNMNVNSSSLYAIWIMLL